MIWNESTQCQVIMMHIFPMIHIRWYRQFWTHGDISVHVLTLARKAHSRGFNVSYLDAMAVWPILYFFNVFLPLMCDPFCIFFKCFPPRTCDQFLISFNVSSVEHSQECTSKTYTYSTIMKSAFKSPLLPHIYQFKSNIATYKSYWWSIPSL